MKKYDFISAGFFMLLGGYVLYETSTYQINGGGQGNPAVWPRTLAIMMIVLSVLLVVQAVWKRPKKTAQGTEEAEETPINWTSPGMIRVYLALAMVAGFVVIMNIFGMLIALLALIPGVMWLMGCKSKVMYVALPVAVVLFVYIFFAKIMTITLPGGLFF